MDNKELIEKYPFLQVRNAWSGEVVPDSTWLDEMPNGWRAAFGMRMVEEISNILKKADYADKYQIVQIKEKFGCYDEETEVLTKSGWKYFKDVIKTDLIATLDEDGETLIYQQPTDIILYPYEGRMYQLQNRGVDLLVTPNHNLYVSKGSYYNGSKNNEKRTYSYGFYTPDAFFNKDKRFKKGCSWIGEKPRDIFNISGYKYSNYMKINNCTRNYQLDDLNFNIISFLQFLGFYVAEGHSNIKDGQGSEISISYNPVDEEELVCKLIKNLGFSIRDSGKGQKRIGNKTLALWLKENCGHLALNKKVPDFIKELPPMYIEEFLKYLYIGDGHKTKTSNILTTISKQLSNDVQELLLKCGYSFRESSREPRITSGAIQGKHKIYEINWLKLTEIEIDNSKSKKILSFKEGWVDYSGNVYCLTVPNHLLYVRRNGKGVWCGNSLRIYDNGAPSLIYEELSDCIDKYAVLSGAICIDCGAKAIGMTRGWIMPVCGQCATNYRGIDLFSTLP